MTWFQLVRYGFMALLILFNSIICSAAAWSLGLASSETPTTPADMYLIVVSSLVLVTVFPILAIDVFRTGAITSRVWVELVWVGTFWILELSGASALSAFTPSLHCDLSSVDPRHATTCTSNRVLLAFAWLSTILLLAYLSTLLTFSLAHSGTHSHVWYTGTHDFPWFSHVASSSPVLPGRSSGRQRFDSEEEKSIETLAPVTWVQELPAKPQSHLSSRPPANADAPTLLSDRAVSWGLKTYLERLGPQPSRSAPSSQPISVPQTQPPRSDASHGINPRLFYSFPSGQLRPPQAHFQAGVVTEKPAAQVVDRGVVTAMGMMTGRIGLTPAQKLVEETKERERETQYKVASPDNGRRHNETSNVSKTAEPGRPKGQRREDKRRPPPLDFSKTTK